MNKITSTMLLSSAMFLLACGDSTVTNVNDEAKEKASVTLLMTDAFTNDPISEVDVYSPFNNKNSASDESGYVTYKGMVIGRYVFDISKKGYATVRITADVEESGQGDVVRVADVFTKVPMFKTGAKVSGSVLFRNAQTKNLEAASKVEVKVNFNSTSIVPSEISTETDSDGSYTFKDLPEGVSFTISVAQSTIDSKTYTAEKSIEVSAMRSDEKREFNAITMDIEGVAPMLVNSNLNDLDSTSKIKLTFSTKLDKDSIDNNIFVCKTSSCTMDSRIPSTVSIDEDGKIITIKSISDKWDVKQTYHIIGTVVSAEGVHASINETFSFTNIDVPGQVSKLKVSAELTGYESTLLSLSWKAPKGVISGYYIYSKTDKEATYSYRSSTYDESYDYTILTEELKESEAISFIVVPYNEAGSANISKAESITYKYEELKAEEDLDEEFDEECDSSYEDCEE